MSWRSSRERGGWARPMVYEDIGCENIHKERNAPHLVRSNKTRTFSRLPYLFHWFVNETACEVATQLTGSPNHQPECNMDSARLYQNSVSVAGS